MITTRDFQITVDDAYMIASAYVSDVLGQTYFTSNGKKQNDGWHFMVKCQRDDMKRTPAVGGVFVCESGQIETLTQDRVRDMIESGEVQAAKERGEAFARDKNGYVLRYHARIKANSWTTDHIDHKVGARGGIFMPMKKPIWRFSIKDSLVDADDQTLDVIDVDAKSGEVFPLTQRQIETIVGGLCAARRLKKQAATA